MSSKSLIKSKLAYFPPLRFPLKVCFSTFDVYTFCICSSCINVFAATGPRADGLLDPGNDVVKQSDPTSFGRVFIPGKFAPHPIQACAKIHSNRASSPPRIDRSRSEFAKIFCFSLVSPPRKKLPNTTCNKNRTGKSVSSKTSC